MKEIQLTRGKVALVDDEDFEWLNQWKWHVSKYGYAMRHFILQDGKRTKKYMHRQILELEKGDGKFVDHIDGNILNFCRSNLRICSKPENNRNQCIRKNNTSGFKGVCWHKASRKWMAHITGNGNYQYLGLFHTPEAAYAAYCEAALKQHGEFANFGDGCVAMKNNDVSR